MASEGYAQIRFRVEKDNLRIDKNDQHEWTVAGTRYSAGAQQIGTTRELVSISSDVASASNGYWKNLDATNYVELGVVVAGTFYPVVKIIAGAIQTWTPAITTALYARANTAAVDLEFVVVEA